MATSSEEEAKIKEEIWKRLPIRYKIMRKFWEEPEIAKETEVNGSIEKNRGETDDRIRNPEK